MSNKNTIKDILPLLFIFCTFLFISHFCWAYEINLKLGESHLLTGGNKIWLEKNNIVQVSEAKGGYLVKGTNPGSTLIKLGQKTIEVFVLNPAQERSLQILNNRIPHSTIFPKYMMEKWLYMKI